MKEDNNKGKKIMKKKMKGKGKKIMKKQQQELSLHEIRFLQKQKMKFTLNLKNTVYKAYVYTDVICI